MSWNIIPTDTFSQAWKKYKKNHEHVRALDKKIKRLQEDPENVGGYLSGKLHGYKSTRLLGKLRLIFRIDLQERKVYLCALDHRKIAYDVFEEEA